MNQLSLFEQLPKSETTPPLRRIDITLGRLDQIVSAMSEDERSALVEKPWWNTLVIISKLRSMEMGEVAVRGYAISSIADTYDRVVTPGEHPVAALLRVFQIHYGPPAPPAIGKAATGE